MMEKDLVSELERCAQLFREGKDVEALNLLAKTSKDLIDVMAKKYNLTPPAKKTSGPLN